ncbi:hypothetical protein HAX54_009149 [Datura stramonium]|uniref:Uncharacterized protein n=1 Tax=Datura stramonium TaxID=4076 RepID=A0ABS8TG56_DATST|nr:hypothetical protein [Datura stramonium]
MGNKTLIRETKVEKEKDFIRRINHGQTPKPLQFGSGDRQVILIIFGRLQRRKEEGATLLTELGWPERRKTKLRAEKRRREVGGKRKMMMRWPPEGELLLRSLTVTMSVVVWPAGEEKREEGEAATFFLEEEEWGKS